MVETPRLLIRPKVRQDAQSLHERVYGDPEVMRFLGGAFERLEQSRAFVEAHVVHQREHGFSMWTAVVRDGGEIIGDAGFLTDPGGGDVEVGVRLRRSAWGQGYATEAVGGVLRFGFETLRFDRVIGVTEVENVASIRVMKKVGMKFVRRGATEGIPPWVE